MLEAREHHYGPPSISRPDLTFFSRPEAASRCGNLIGMPARMEKLDTLAASTAFRTTTRRETLVDAVDRVFEEIMFVGERS